MPYTRRRWLQDSFAAVMGTSVCRAQLTPWLRLLGDESLTPTPLLTTAIHVPRDFTGLHAHRWPVGQPVSPPPTFGYGAARSHDLDGAAWYRIHLAPGAFDWAILDRWVRVHAAAGHTLVYTLYGTPSWLSERADQPDLYGHAGGAAAPRDLSALEEFITALVQRYNGDGRRRLHFLETWNEPHFRGHREDFWWGTAEQLVAVGRACNQAAKRVDPGIRVLSPGFVGDLAGGLSLQLPALAAAQRSSVYQYLTASDGHGATGSQWCDGLAFHCYNAPWEGENAGYLLGIRKLQKMLAMMQLRLPLYDTEMGFMPSDPFHQLPPAKQGDVLRRVAAMQAALGVQALFFYAYDDDLVGNPSLHPEIAKAIADVHTMVAGKTLQQVTALPDGRVEIVTTERTFLW